MTIREQAIAGKIMNVPLNGSPQPIQELPKDMKPHYSGAILILAGDQTEGDENLSIKSEFAVKVIGNAVVLSQATWHKINP